MIFHELYDVIDDKNFNKNLFLSSIDKVKSKLKVEVNKTGDESSDKEISKMVSQQILKEYQSVSQ